MKTKQAKLQVVLLSSTSNPLELIYSAFRQCYSPGFVGDMWPRLLSGEISKDKQNKLIENILESGHDSPIEHVSFSFAVSGISRALSHQLVRHRIASYSQQSQRYVSEDAGFEYVLPPSIAKIPEAREEYEALMEHIQSKYELLQGFLESDMGKGEKTSQDARFVLPNASETKMVVTMNCRSLINFFELRCCERAQWEIRKMAWKMLKLVRSELPIVFNTAGPKCEKSGYCPEGEKFTCGKYQILSL